MTPRKNSTLPPSDHQKPIPTINRVDLEQNSTPIKPKLVKFNNKIRFYCKRFKDSTIRPVIRKVELLDYLALQARAQSKAHYLHEMSNTKISESMLKLTTPKVFILN